MGITTPSPAVLRLLAAFSRHDAALDWARETSAEKWGTIALESPRFEFNETDFYQEQMGVEIRKTFFVFEALMEPDELPDVKLLTNAWELQYAELHRHAESRPLNLDPGYLTEGKLVLASTKDHAHRVYLRDGIYAEVTLGYRSRQWRTHEWTYPDYQREDFHQFFDACRSFLRERRKRAS